MREISIVIPVYNAEKTLVRCVESIVNQTYKSWELWLVDDGSSDASGEICDNYALIDTRVHVVHRKNNGVSSARNIGIEKSSGEYVMFVDSDDYLEHNALDILMGAIDKYEADIVMCGFFYHDEEGGEEEPNYIEKLFVGDNENFASEIFNDVFRKELLNPPWNKAIKKSILQQNQLRFVLDYSICEDMIFTIDVLNCCKRIVFLNVPLYHYIYKKGDNLVNKFHSNYYDALSVYYSKIKDYLKAKKAITENRICINKFLVEKTIAYLKRIYSYEEYSASRKYSELKRICEDELFRKEIYEYETCKIKKKIVKECVKHRFYGVLHLLYLCI